MNTPADHPAKSIPYHDAGYSEIILLPDGRVYVHGTTRPLLEMLAQLKPADPRLALLAGARRMNETPSEKENR
jgi:hypothetical protein